MPRPSHTRLIHRAARHGTALLAGVSAAILPACLALPAAVAHAATPKAVHAATPAGDLRAGAGRVAITPPASIFPYKVPREHDFVGVHDDVYARALVLDDGKARAVIVSLELTQVPEPAAMVADVARAAGVTPDHVMVVATHTHNVPLTFYHGEVTNPAQPAEMARARAGAVAAVKAALAALAPARISHGRGQAPVNTNNGEAAGVAGGFDPDGPSDKSLDIVRLTDRAGNPLALLVNYASHGEVMFRSVTRDGGYEVSGDLPGAVSRLLENTPGGAPVVLFTPGAEGDQLPQFKSLQAAGRLPGTDEGAGGWALLDVQARRLAHVALGTIATLPQGDATASLHMTATEATCPGQHYEIERPSGKVLGVQDTAPVRIPVAVLRINDLVLAGVGADLASSLGQAIKAGMPAGQTTVLSMLSGAVGYVLEDRAYQHPGHGAAGSPVKPGCAGVVLPATVAAAARLTGAN